MNTSKNKWYKLFFFQEGNNILVLLIACLIVSAFLGAMTPKLIADLSRNFDSDFDFKISLKALLINFIAVYINRVIYQLSVNKYVRMMIQYARTQTYQKWIYSRENNSDKYPQGEIISRIMSDTDAIRDLITSGAFGIFIDLFFVISCLVGFIRLQKFTGFFIALAEVLATILLIWGSRLMRDVFMRLRNSQANVNRVTANVLGGFHQMYYTRHEQYASTKSSMAFDEFLKNQNHANTMDASYYAIAESLYPILLAFVIFIFPYSQLTQASIIFAIVDLIQRSINPIKEISGKIANIQRAFTGLDRIQHFLTDIGDVKMIEDKKDGMPHSFLRLDVDIAYFEYPKRMGNDNEQRENFHLKDICFSGKPGELIGIVGLSGSGKSTLLNILSGNIFAPQAKVVLEMKNDKTFHIGIDEFELYRKEVSIVSQDSHIFSESLMFNITLKRDEPADFNDEWEFLKKNIPYLNSWGISPSDKISPSMLSLGQRQLLAGIRACYIKKHVVFFDEISSALDSELELALRNLVLLIQKYSLTIIVAHRIETIIGASKIIVMDKGKVKDSGNHDQLLSRSQIYREFVQELSHS